jgi:hypothetical protein
MLDAMIVSRLSMDWELILIGALPGKICLLRFWMRFVLPRVLMAAPADNLRTRLP